jgi:hypothetical protein
MNKTGAGSFTFWHSSLDLNHGERIHKTVATGRAERRIKDHNHSEAAMKDMFVILHAGADDRHRPRNPQDSLWL